MFPSVKVQQCNNGNGKVHPDVKLKCIGPETYIRHVHAIQKLDGCIIAKVLNPVVKAAVLDKYAAPCL